MLNTTNSVQKRKKILITGVVQLWEGHSNVEHKIKLLSDRTLYASKSEIFPIRFKIDYRSTFTKLTSTVSLISKLILGSLFCLVKILINRGYNNIYLPYPGLILLLLISLLPRRAIPASITLDFFISIYDTVVIDRALLKQQGVLARLLYKIERRSIIRTNICLVDTEENATYYSKLFDVPIGKFKAIPLSIDEECFAPTNVNSAKLENEPLRVLFAGTMVPLQGIPYICETIRTLSNNEAFCFVIVGDGQDSIFVEELSNDLKSANSTVGFKWIRKWMSSSELSEEIRKADVCLGIFGSSNKANRVWPFKNYLYMACRKMLITRSSATTAQLTKLEPEHAFRTIDISEKHSLSSCLLELLDKKTLIKEYATDARDYYTNNLSSTVISNALWHLLR